MKEVEVVEKEYYIEAFNPLRAQILEYKEENAKLVFDYESTKGDKAARSHIQMLRHTKSALTSIHKERKAAALQECRYIDNEKKEILGDIEDMIEVHAEPLRVIKERADKLITDEVEAYIMEAERANAEKQEAMRLQQEELDRKYNELKAKEDVILAKQAEQDRAEREQRIAKDAKLEAEQAHIKAIADAELKRVADIQAAEDKLRREQADKEAAEKRRIDADQAETDRIEAIAKKKREGVEHRRKVNNEVLGILTEYGMDEDNAKALVSDVAREKFPALTINY